MLNEETLYIFMVKYHELLDYSDLEYKYTISLKKVSKAIKYYKANPTVFNHYKELIYDFKMLTITETRNRNLKFLLS